MIFPARIRVFYSAKRVNSADKAAAADSVEPTLTCTGFRNFVMIIKLYLAEDEL